MKPLRILVLVLMLATLGPLSQPAAGSGSNVYIVSLKRDRDPEATAKKHGDRYGLTAKHFYTNVISGYSALVDEDRVQHLREDPDVLMVSPNRAFVAAGVQEVPKGVLRIGAATIPGTGEGIQVAVLDTGIDLQHPDLAGNIIGGKYCPLFGESQSGSFDDANGHGTHVAGTIAAIDNTTGVRGVAPKAKLWAVRVLDAGGAGDLQSLLCGLDFVYDRAPTQNGFISVANMSVQAAIPNADDGNCGFDDGEILHSAVCSVVDAGVSMVVAAGNQNRSGPNIKDVAPAAYDEVIAVTALADYDGAPCGEDAQASDDTFAGVSNYATLASDLAHTVGAPGVNILSTIPGGGVGLNTGTSMASPHVAGVIARYLQTHPGTPPATVLQVIKDNAEPKDVDFNDECPGTTASHTDPSGLHPEPVVRAVDWELDIQAATPGIVRGNKWYLNNGFDGVGDIVFSYGSPSDKVVVGDWDGDGIDTPGIVRGNVWYLNNGFDPFAELAFAYGSSTDRPIVGDWDGDGFDTIGVVRGNVWYVNNTLDPTSDVPAFAYGSSTDRIIAGDWDGDDTDTPGIVRGNVWYLNDNFDPNADQVFGFGATTDVPVAGDWVGDNTDRPGLHRSNKWFLNLGFDAGAEIVFPYGLPSDRFVAGDWDGETPP